MYVLLYPSASIPYFSECLLLKTEGWRDAGICREKNDIVACEQQRGRPNCASAQSGEQLWTWFGRKLRGQVFSRRGPIQNKITKEKTSTNRHNLI